MQIKGVGPTVKKQGQPTAERVKQGNGGGAPQPTRPDAAFPPPSTFRPPPPSPITVMRTPNVYTNTVSLGAPNTMSEYHGSTNYAMVSPALMQPLSMQPLSMQPRSHSRPPSAQGICVCVCVHTHTHKHTHTHTHTAPHPLPITRDDLVPKAETLKVSALVCSL